jgi:hypothetical protein
MQQVVVGLWPGDWNHMTLHVLAILAAALTMKFATALLSTALPASTLTAPTRVSTHQGTQAATYGMRALSVLLAVRRHFASFVHC